MLEVQVHPLVKAILRFIQLRKLLPPLKLMAQSRRGVVQMPEAQVHPSKLFRALEAFTLEKCKESTPIT
jgi:hypothetical protein